MSTSPPLVVADRYRLIAPLGQGGMGRVWRATDVVLHREVAIKELVPPPGLTPDERREMRERSLREARAIARLNNVNVVRVFDVLRTDADPWIVMEYVPSRSLQDILAADGPFAPIRAAEIGLGVLNALRAAHRAGVVHRDVKPGNVLIGDDDRVVLTDFGLATVPGDPNVTRTGLVLGSPAYIAPERARDGSAGPGADLWSLGATLYAAVEGASPFARPSAIATLAALATENPPPARNAGPLKPVLNGLLRKDPAHRINAEEAERLLLRATGRRSRLSFPMSPTMRRPGAGRERPAPSSPPVVPGVSASAPVVPGPRPPISPARPGPATSGRPPIFAPGKASVGGQPAGTPTRVDAEKPPALDATRIENPDRSRTGTASSPPPPASASAARGSAADATMRGSGSAPGSFTADEVAAARKRFTGRSGAPATPTRPDSPATPESQRTATPAPRAAAAAPTVADSPATAAPQPATPPAAPGSPEPGPAAEAATAAKTPDTTAPAAAGMATATADTATTGSDTAEPSAAPGAPKGSHQPFGPRPSGAPAGEPTLADETASTSTGTDSAAALEAATAAGATAAGAAATDATATDAAATDATATDAAATGARAADATAAEATAADVKAAQPAEDIEAAAGTTPAAGAGTPGQAATTPDQVKEDAAAAKPASATKAARKRGRTAKTSTAAAADKSAQAVPDEAAEDASEAGAAALAPQAVNSASGDATPDDDVTAVGTAPDQDAAGSAADAGNDDAVGDGKTSDDVAGDDTSSDGTTSDDVAGKDAASDDAAGNDAAGDDVVGDDAPRAEVPEGGTGAAKPEPAKPADRRGAATGPDRTRIIKPVTDPDAPKPRSGTAKRPQKTAAERKSALAATRVGAASAAPVVAGTSAGAEEPVPGVAGFGQPNRPAWQPMNFRAPSAGARGVTVFGTTLTRRQTVIAIGMIVAVLLALVVLIPQAFGGNDDDQAKDKGRQPGAAPTAGATKPSTSTAPAPPVGQQPSSPSPSSSPPAPKPSSVAPGGVTIPKGWYRYSDATGFSVPVPDGVQITHQGSEVYFRKDNRLLIIDQTDQPKPNPVADWKDQERDRRGRAYRNYERIKIKPVDYFVKAADWEFTYTTTSGNPQHAVKRGVITKAGKRAYGISWYTSPDDWKDGLKDLQLIYDGFKPKS